MLFATYWVPVCAQHATVSKKIKPVDTLLHSENKTSPKDLLSALSANIAPETLALANIIRKVSNSVKKMPNYTCRQTIRRKRMTVETIKDRNKKSECDGSKNCKGTHVVESRDSLKVDVAFASGKELYSWPNAENFEEKPLSEMVGFGTVSTGEFAAHARTIFVNRSAQLTYTGEVDLEKRRAIRYEFSVPLFRSGYIISDSTGQARVAYSGSIWADIETKNLLRIEIKIEDAPPSLTISSVVNRLDYETVSLGETDFQLPKRGHLITYFRSGSENHNWVEFSGCREFSVQSELSFTGNLEGDLSENNLEAQELTLPPEMPVRFELETAIESATSSAGDELRAKVVREVKHRGKILIPKGAVVVGRLRRLESFSDPVNHSVVAFGFHRVEFDNNWATLHGTLTDIEAFPGLEGQHSRSSEIPASTRRVGISQTGASAVIKIPEQRTLRYRSLILPGTVELYVRGEQFQIPKGHQIVWTTLRR